MLCVSPAMCGFVRAFPLTFPFQLFQLRLPGDGGNFLPMVCVSAGAPWFTFGRVSKRLSLPNACLLTWLVFAATVGAYVCSFLPTPVDDNIEGALEDNPPRRTLAARAGLISGAVACWALVVFVV